MNSPATQSTPTQARPHGAPVVVRTPSDLRAYLSGYAVPSQSPATIAALARMDAALRMAVTGR